MQALAQAQPTIVVVLQTGCGMDIIRGIAVMTSKESCSMLCSPGAPLVLCMCTHVVKLRLAVKLWDKFI